MKLYICWGTFKPAPRPGGHPCGKAHGALEKAGYDPEVIRTYGWAVLPSIFNRSRGRREVEKLTGNIWVPVLVTDDGTVIQGSDKIIAWAKANPATQTPASAAAGA
jgi:hypothetical protein